MELVDPPVADVEVEEPFSDILTNADRCDQCGAQAFLRVVMPDAKELHFCGHHFNRGEIKLRELAIDVLDERWKINRKPSQSAPD